MTAQSGSPPYGYFQALWHRIGILRKQAFNNGVGYFLLSMCSVIVCVISVRIAADYHSDYSDKLQGQLACLGAETEPQREDHYAGISALLLGAINLNSDETSQRHSDPSGYRIVSESREVVADLALRISAVFDSAGGKLRNRAAADSFADSVINALEMDHAVLFNAIRTDGALRWDDNFRKIVRDVVLQVLPPYSPLAESGQRASARSWPAAMISSPKLECESVVLVPSQYAADVTDLSMRPETLSAIEKRLRESLTYSRLLDVSAMALESLNAAYGERDQQCPWFQTYFISPDNVLRFWHQDRQSREIVSRLPPMRLWAAAKFEQDLFGKTSSYYRSRAYLDFAAGGVVFTEAAPCTLSNGHVVGIIGTDFRVATKDFLRSVDDGVLFFDMRHVVMNSEQLANGRGAKVYAPPARSIWRRLFAVFEPDINAASLVPSAERSWREVTGKESRAATEVVKKAHDKAQFGREIQGIQGDGVLRYVVPIGATNGSRADVLVLSPRSLSLPAEVVIFGVAGILCGAMAISLFFVGHQLCRRDNELEARRALLRGLQVGFVRIDRNEVIVEGNDRAEEILGVALPMVAAASSARARVHDGDVGGGTGAAACGPRLREFINTDYVLLRGERSSGVRLVDYASILDQLNRGRRSLAYVRHAKKNEWMSLMSTPILVATRSSVAGGFFATFDVLNEIESNAVDLALAALRAQAASATQPAQEGELGDG